MSPTIRTLRTLSVAEVMERTGFSRDHVYRLIHAGQLATVRTSAKRTASYRVLERSLEAFIDAADGAVVPATPARVLDADAALPPIDNPAFD